MAGAFVSAPSFAQSAKFAASWDTDAETASSSDACVAGTCSDNPDGTEVELEMATLHVGAQKSILVGVSSEIGIYLLTEAKGGKNSTGDFSSTAMAEGIVDVTLSLVASNGEECTIAY